MPTDLLIVSNRGPLTFRPGDDGTPVPKRGAGGLVSGLAPLVEGTSTTWVAAAITDSDRVVARDGLVEADGFRIRLLELDPDDYRRAYDEISNATLWFLHHELFDRARRPAFDRQWRSAWEAYRRVNEAFAHAIAETAPPGATVLLQDYHLSLTASALRSLRPDVVSVHFHHTPFCHPSDLEILPPDVAHDLFTGLTANDACGFHTDRWASAFADGCRKVLGHVPTTFVSPLATDPQDIRRTAASAECDAAAQRIDELVGDRQLIVRSDRIELSKNLLRGFLALDELLEVHPEWRERVVMGAFVYPSREGVPEYQTYRHDVEELVAAVNTRWATAGWTPIVLDMEDDFPRSVAALRRYDVLVVNPIRDGLNLVASEGILVNERDGSVILSTEAGAHEVLGDVVDAVSPFDVSATATALHIALSRSPEERRVRAERARKRAEERTPRDWLDDQLAAAARTRPT